MSDSDKRTVDAADELVKADDAWSESHKDGGVNGGEVDNVGGGVLADDDIGLTL